MVKLSRARVKVMQMFLTHYNIMYHVGIHVYMHVHCTYMYMCFFCSSFFRNPRFPGLTRGLVAVLLYHDGRRCLVSALRSLIQAREGVAWTLGIYLYQGG